MSGLLEVLRETAAGLGLVESEEEERIRVISEAKAEARRREADLDAAYAAGTTPEQMAIKKVIEDHQIDPTDVELGVESFNPVIHDARATKRTPGREFKDRATEVFLAQERAEKEKARAARQTP